MRKFIPHLLDLFHIHGLARFVGLSDTLLVPSLRTLLAFVLHRADQLLVAPANLMGKIAKHAEFPETRELDCSHGIWDDLSLHSVVGGGYTIEHFESAHGGSSAGSFVRDHASYSSPEHARGSPVMNESTSRVGEESFSEELMEFGFVSKKGAGDVDRFASHHNDPLA